MEERGRNMDANRLVGNSNHRSSLCSAPVGGGAVGGARTYSGLALFFTTGRRPVPGGVTTAYCGFVRDRS